MDRRYLRRRTRSASTLGGKTLEEIKLDLPASSIDCMPYVAKDGAGGQTMNSTTEFVVNLDTEGIANANYSLANDEITISAAGNYWVAFQVTFNANANVTTARGGWASWLEVDSGGGWGDAGDHLWDSGYWREQAHYNSTCGAGPYVATAGDKIRLMTAFTEGATAAFPLVANRSWVSMIKL